jgi:hypothetical protein
VRHEAARVTPPIRDYASLVDALVARQGGLSRRLAQVAQFCLNNPEDVAINNIVASPG